MTNRDRVGRLGRGLLVTGMLVASIASAWSLTHLVADDVPASVVTQRRPGEQEAAREELGGGRAAPAVPAELPGAHHPGSRIEMRVPRTTRGIPCPDGTYLPLLNGVPEAPPITRSARFGPVPPVVAKIVDSEGGDWYEHADGSTTTTRWRTLLADGVATVRVETVHNIALPEAAAMPRAGPSGGVFPGRGAATQGVGASGRAPIR